MRATTTSPPEEGMLLDEDFLSDEEGMAPSQTSTEQEAIAVYNYDDGADTVYQAIENDDGTFTISSEDSSKIISSDEFGRDYALWVDPSLSANKEDPETDKPEEDPNELDDQEKKSDTVLPGDYKSLTPDPLGTTLRQNDQFNEIERQPSNAPGNVSAGSQTNTTQNQIAGLADSIIGNLAALASGAIKGSIHGANNLIKTTSKEFKSVKGLNRIEQLQGHIDAANRHIDTIAADPDYQKEMAQVETGVLTLEDARNNLNDRFGSEDPDIQDRELNKAYHRLNREMGFLNAFDMKEAGKKIDLFDENQDEAFADVRRSVNKLTERDELETLPSEGNESMKEAAKKVFDQIKDLFKKVMDKLTSKTQSQESSTPSMS